MNQPQNHIEYESNREYNCRYCENMFENKNSLYSHIKNSSCCKQYELGQRFWMEHTTIERPSRKERSRKDLTESKHS